MRVTPVRSRSSQALGVAASSRNGSSPAHGQTGGRWRRLALLFVYAWMVYTLIQGGSLLTREPYLQTLHVAPRAAQGGALDGYAQTLIKLERTLPYDQRVLVVWRRPSAGVVGFWYGYFWATYWLYPRRVDIVTDPSGIQSSYGVVLDVRSVDQPDVAPPPNFTVTATYEYADQVVTVLREPHA